jgi:putative transposase
MPEHVHVLLTPSENQTIERCAQCIKGGFSHEVRAQFHGEVWQVGFHEHRIRGGEDFRRQLVYYIAANPQKRGLIDWDFVRARFIDRLDPMPAHLEMLMPVLRQPITVQSRIRIPIALSILPAQINV